MGLASKLAAFAARLTSDSKVPATGLAAGAARANFGAGAFVQQKTGASTSEYSLGSSVGVWVDAVAVQLTTKLANSIVVIEAVGSMDRTGGNYPAIEMRIHAYKNGVSVGILTNQQFHEYEGNNQEHHIAKHPIQGWHTAQDAGDVWTYYLQMANQSGSSPGGTYGGYINRYGMSTMLVREIAG